MRGAQLQAICTFFRISQSENLAASHLLKSEYINCEFEASDQRSCSTENISSIFYIFF